MDFQVHYAAFTCHYSIIYLIYISPFREEVQYLKQEQVIMCTEFLRTQKQILLYSCYEYKNVASYYITLSHMETNKAANIINLT